MPDAQRPRRVTNFNHLWHTDADHRRHHGARRWDAHALSAFVDLTAGISYLYPPDWSDADTVRLAASGRKLPFALIRTDSPAELSIILNLRRPTTARGLGRMLGIPCRQLASRKLYRRVKLSITQAAQVQSPAFTRFFGRYARDYGRIS